MTIKERNKKILAAIKEQTARAVVSREIARQTLIEEGIYTKSGDLCAEFGGSGKKKKAAA